LNSKFSRVSWLIVAITFVACSSGGTQKQGGTGGLGGEPTAGSGGGGGAPSGGKGGNTGGSGGGAGSGGGMAGTGGSTRDASAPPDKDASPGTGGAGGVADASVPMDTGGAGGGPPPSGNPYVYVGTGFSGSQIRIFQLDMQTGALASKGTATAATAPTYMAFHPTRKFAYAAAELANRLVAFSVNPTTGALTRLNDVASAGDGPAHVNVHKSGKWLFVANYNDGNAAVLPIDAEGRLGAPVSNVKPVTMTAHNMQADPAGRYVFLCSTETSAGNRIFQYLFDEATGKLTPNTPPSASGMGEGPRHLSFHPSAKYAYAVGEGGGSLIAFDYDATKGLLSNPMVTKIGGSQGAHVLVHPSGKLVYASIRSPSILAGFSIDANGRPKLIEKVTDGLASPWDFDIDASGKYLLVANDQGGIRVFKIDEQSGALTAAGAGVSGGGPHYVGVMYPP
jgi:6-phosphogluconolactonase